MNVMLAPHPRRAEGRVRACPVTAHWALGRGLSLNRERAPSELFPLPTLLRAKSALLGLLPGWDARGMRRPAMGASCRSARHGGSGARGEESRGPGRTRASKGADPPGPRVPDVLRAGGTGWRARSLWTEAPVPVSSSALEGVTVKHPRARCSVRLRGDSGSGGGGGGQGSWPSRPPVIPPALSPE